MFASILLFYFMWFYSLNSFTVSCLMHFLLLPCSLLRHGSIWHCYYESKWELVGQETKTKPPDELAQGSKLVGDLARAEWPDITQLQSLYYKLTNDMTMELLKAELTTAGLRKTGLKKDLVKRIIAHRFFLAGAPIQLGALNELWASSERLLSSGTSSERALNELWEFPFAKRYVVFGSHSIN